MKGGIRREKEREKRWRKKWFRRVAEGKWMKARELDEGNEGGRRKQDVV